MWRRGIVVLSLLFLGGCAAHGKPKLDARGCYSPDRCNECCPMPDGRSYACTLVACVEEVPDVD
jgi:hypothetical protein